jgi:hypothetical protein
MSAGGEGRYKCACGTGSLVEIVAGHHVET